MKQKAHRQAGFLLWPHEPTRVAAALRQLVPSVLILALAGCSSSPPVVVTETIHVPTFIPYPVTLVKPVQVTLTTQDTWGTAVGRLYDGLQRCDANLVAIATLKPPPGMP